MKKIATLMIFLLLVSLGKTANAQFLEKLGKKVEERVENTIINKTANKAEKETGNAMDGVLEPKKKTSLILGLNLNNNLNLLKGVLLPQSLTLLMHSVININ